MKLYEVKNSALSSLGGSRHSPRYVSYSKTYEKENDRSD